MGNNQTNKKHVAYFDVMRILAAFCVILNHTPGYLLYQKYAPNTIQYWLYMVIAICCNFAVPLFFMISGILLLGRQDDIRYTLKHRSLRIFVVLIVFSAISYIEGVLLGNLPGDFANFAKLTYQTAENGAYWYLYSYLAYTLSLPLLQCMVEKMKKQHFQYLFLLYMLVEPGYKVFTYCILKNQLWKNASFNVEWIVTNFIIFTLWGYYLEKVLTEEEFLQRAKYYISAGVLAVAAAAVLTWHSCCVRMVDVGSQYFYWFIFFYCGAAYTLIKLVYLKLKLPERAVTVLKLIGANVFGVYLIHAILIRIPVIANLYWIMDQQWHWINMVSAFIYTTIIFVISFAISYLLRKIPGVKKFV